ncbi:hypothetical protein [Planctomicrobium sp. SH664]|uniref:hypothetical protein n=1 Tax=Planctomicrobium sp. SH664 TaxID=3448125 RepID=UPI003F5C56D0
MTGVKELIMPIMPLENLYMSAAAMVLFAAVFGTASFGPFALDRASANVLSQPTVRDPVSQVVNGSILQVDLKELTVTTRVAITGERKVLKIAPNATIFKDDRKVGLDSLMRGDHAVFYLSSPGSDVVTRIVSLSVL